VRRQSHFRTGSRGLNACDVPRLVAAADEASIEDVPLAEIGDSANVTTVARLRFWLVAGRRLASAAAWGVP
jgi:hypothetical protein